MEWCVRLARASRFVTTTPCTLIGPSRVIPTAMPGVGRGAGWQVFRVIRVPKKQQKGCGQSPGKNCASEGIWPCSGPNFVPIFAQILLGFALDGRMCPFARSRQVEAVHYAFFHPHRQPSEVVRFDGERGNILHSKRYNLACANTPGKGSLDTEPNATAMENGFCDRDDSDCCGP